MDSSFASLGISKSHSLYYIQTQLACVGLVRASPDGPRMFQSVSTSWCSYTWPRFKVQTELLHSVVARFHEQKQKVPGLFQTSPRTGAASLLLHSIGESKSKGQSKFCCRGIDFTSLWVEKNAHTGREEIDSDHLWRLPHTQVAITGLFMHQLDS